MRFAIFATSIVGISGFQTPLPSYSRGVVSLFETTIEEPAIDVATTLAKNELLATATSLNEKFGPVLIDSGAQESLNDAVKQLEAVADAPGDASGLIGDWTLLCSTASASLENGPVGTIGGIDTGKLPFFNEGPVKEIRDRLKKSIKVEQLIKAESTNGIDRVDHVIDYTPPDTISEFLNNLPDAIKSLNINPLQVSETKVILVHKAVVESVIPVVKTKLTLESVVLNVAGKSQNLDPNGADVLGVNVPFGEFLNAGSFETTYMDESVRISRSKTGIVDQLRVFVKSEPSAVVAEEEEEDYFFVDEEEELMDEDSSGAPSDVEGDL